ncbi:hypothetical protein [Streptomyces europaeiscabiei]|uniref:hypothetical protein n=1 Tax=Streptomyces europaeiscabiei TaxID=146819 RepID=UPI000765E127|nr:hypothetical protein [Streptomyces europaeiscabiei]MDX2530875.1 hypothetical protein [Streptomyces europaeiscabiei]MDX2765969.1 hypothetical protein [Streptomyces europaeiscabiei]MDX3666080.1 hypothetical protein [Streptomyces europaeiscabiei]MDX3714063.1 hypothetical protein [Streptomyces europaeiscabiei]MDX3781882.1 hypothetical protein [Streptomyces europaeiscabiei]
MTTATTQRHLLMHMTANGSLGPEGKDLLVVRRGEGVRRGRGRQALHRRPVRAVARGGLIVDLMPRRLCEAGLPARVHNRSAPLVQIAPPLLSDRVLLDRIADTLTDASARI